MSITDTTLNAERIASALEARHIGWKVYHHPLLSSTMDEAHRLAQAGTPELTAVVADEQTAGRGRLNRRWWSPAGDNLLLSLILRPPLSPSQAHRLTMACSLGICDAVGRVSGLRAQVKWPNDLLIGGRKLCGILTELEMTGEQLDYAIVGIGLNVNADLRDAPPLLAPATSMLMEAGHEFSRLEVLVTVLEELERRYRALCAGQTFHHEWAERMVTLGQHVQVREGTTVQSGTAVGVDKDGALLLRDDDGILHRVLVGDVTLHTRG